MTGIVVVCVITFGTLYWAAATSEWPTGPVALDEAIWWLLIGIVGGLAFGEIL